jgi:hypothetical protein
MDVHGGQDDPDSDDETASAWSVYDAVMKEMFERDLIGGCQILGVPVNGEPVALATEFKMTKRAVDLLARVGPRRLMHVECARRATWELVARMLVYRGLIMQSHPKDHVSQHIVILGEGTVRGYDDYAGNGFALDLNLLYLRSADPEAFLHRAGFAPLAILRRGDLPELEELAGRAVKAVQKYGGERADRLLEFITELAPIASHPSIVERAIKEAEMTIQSIAAFYRNTEFGQEIRAEGREEGREEGRQEGRHESLTIVLQSRFGRHPAIPVVADRLVVWADHVAALNAASTAASLDELLRLDPPE